MGKILAKFNKVEIDILSLIWKSRKKSKVHEAKTGGTLCPILEKSDPNPTHAMVVQVMLSYALLNPQH